MHRSELARTRDVQWAQLVDLVRLYADRQPVRKVAVVGNAPLEPSAERAADIDSADLVIRANSMMLDRPHAEPCFGTRCHVVVLSQMTALTPDALSDHHRRLYLVPQAGWVNHRYIYRLPGDRSFWPSDLGAIPLPNATVKRRLVDLLDPGAPPGEHIPTSGTIGIFLGHEIFPEAELVGTGLSFLTDTEQTAWQHSSGGSTTVNPRHNLGLEQKLLRRWMADGSLRIAP